MPYEVARVAPRRGSLHEQGKAEYRQIRLIAPCNGCPNLIGSDRSPIRAQIVARNPFDRVIARAARVHGLALIPEDATITKTRIVPALW